VRNFWNDRSAALADAVQISIRVSIFPPPLGIHTDRYQAWTSVPQCAATTRNTVSLTSTTSPPAAQSVRTAIRTPHATPYIIFARAQQPSPLVRLKQLALVVLEAVRVPVPINVPRRLEEDVAHSIHNAEVVPVFPFRSQLRAPLFPRSRMDVLRTR
jgi:hypothetical protein